MTEAVFDFKSIAEIARLRALEGRPQDEVVAGIAQAIPVNCQKHALPNCSVCRIEAAEPPEGWHVYWQNALYGVTDTAPSEYSPPDWDGA